LTITNKDIADLTGVGAFTGLKSLDCSLNKLTVLPILPAGLERLICWANKIASLANLPNGLIYVECYANKLTSLPTLPNTLTHLYCFSNLLASLPDLPVGLTFLACSSNQLTSLPTLPSGLKNLFCYSNSLVSLPTLPSTLTKLYIDADKITCLPNSVAGLEVYTGNTDVLITPPVCPPPIHIPDDNFAAAIRNTCSTCIDASDNLLPPAANLTQLNVSNKNIVDLTGISGFTGLKQLDCYSNNLTSLPILPNNLEILTCYENKLTSLPILPNSLTDLSCHLNQLSLLPALPNSLQVLNCNLNKVTSLPTLPSTLIQLYCFSNQLTSLPALPNGLKTLYCSSNQLTSLPSLPNTLTAIYIDPDKITCLPNSVEGLQVRDASFRLIPTPPVCTPFTPIHIPDDNFAAAIRTVCPACINASDTLLPPAANLTFLTLFNKNISDLTGIHGFTGLKEFYCNNNKLTIIPPLPSNLERFYCNNNQLTSLSILPNGLKALSCYGNLMYCLPTLPNSLSDLSIDINKIKCLPNTVAGLKVHYDDISINLTFSVCTEACSNTSCTPPPTPSLTANPGTIKIGESSTLTATGCAGTVTWTTGQTGNSITVSPTSFVSYRAFCTVDGCSSGYTNININIACEVPTPSLLATPSTISVGDSSTITATGCTGTLTWYLSSGGSSIGTGNSIKVKPIQTTGYNANCLNGGCSSSAYIQVTVPCSVPSPSISANPSVISAGESSTLTAIGCAGTVTWWSSNTGGQPIGTGNSLTVTPIQTTNYNANCTVNNCSSSSSSVQVIIPCSVPTPSVSASPGIINVGQSSTLTATGCTGSVTWFKVGQGLLVGTGGTIMIAPVSTSEYYAFCNVNGCSSGDARIAVAVICEVPATPSLMASPNTINSGQNATLTATNCTGMVTWSTGQTGSSITVSPTSNTLYSATCTVNGCQSSHSFVSVTVTTNGLRVSNCTPPASPSVSASTYTANPSQPVTLTATNCTGLVNWQNNTTNMSLGTGVSIVVTPTETTDYFAYCVLNGCGSSSSYVKIAVLCTTPTPSVSATPSFINTGEMATLNATNCNGTVSWFRSGTALGITGGRLTVTQTQSATYAANCTYNGCTSSKAYAYVQVGCAVPLTPSLLASPSRIQLGQNSTLTATGCAGTVTWYSSGGGTSIGTGNSITVKPTQSTNYYAYCVVNNCSSSNSNVYVDVLCTSPPTPSVVASPSAVSAGQSTTLTATNCTGTITWYKSGINTPIGTGNSLSVIVTQPSYYYAYCSVNNCQSNNSGVGVNINCEVPPSPSVSASPSRINPGQTSTLSATGCAGTVTWYNAANGVSLGTGNNLVVSPQTLTTYMAYCNGNNCSSGGANVEVFVITNPCPSTKVLSGIISTSTPITEKAQVSITSSQSLQSNANVTYQSPVIIFNPGTEIHRGAVFKTIQRGCD